ncbi:MAG: hypothetical protein BLM47_10665 [Candidatus Reconcilbacillus cellulovorans]|uniref:6-hydroxymethylpterin diphosphokinase MptE-like domain-containing protein n=1 Tax=Candidatus Reconcilbacillus cellulovorans TaxID=1906605 RepID=A0A2A6DYN1_9BACL|nr:MAG: hypothetical protein BLM47_10665 [Candidatus Reconcilbacillus cellulovorans]
MQRVAEQTIGNVATYSKFGDKLPLLILKNFFYTCRNPSILAAKGRYHGVPALIVGSGPSLDADLPLLKRLDGRCLIIAAGSSIQPLMKANLRPHMVVSVDPGVPNYYVFQNLNLENVPLVFAPTIYHKISEMKSFKVWFRVNVDYITDFLLPPEPEEPSFISTASVTGVCIQLAAYFGCHPILLVGQDLSYPDRTVYASHVDHATEEGKERILQAIDRQVENVSGGVNPTTLTMLNILRSIEEIIEFHPHIRFINVSRIGARIRGTEWMPLDRWEEEDLRLRPDAPPIVPLMSVVDASEPVRRLPKALERLREAKSGLVDIAGRLERINGLLERLKRAEETRSALKAATLALRLEGEWNELLKNPVYCAFYSLPTTLVVDTFLRARPVIAAERDPIARARMLLQYFEPVVRKSEEMTPKLVRNVQALLNYFGD